MGWWASAENESLMVGDDAVDIFEQALDRYVSREPWRGQTGGPKPDWQDLLDALDAALTYEAERISDGPLGNRQFVARFADGSTRTSRRDLGSARYDELENLIEVLSSVAYEIGRSYERGTDRRPSFAELGLTIAFSLRVEPERFLKGGPNLESLIVSERPA